MKKWAKSKLKTPRIKLKPKLLNWLRSSTRPLGDTSKFWRSQGFRVDAAARGLIAVGMRWIPYFTSANRWESYSGKASKARTFGSHQLRSKSRMKSQRLNWNLTLKLGSSVWNMIQKCICPLKWWKSTRCSSRHQRNHSSSTQTSSNIIRRRSTSTMTP